MDILSLIIAVLLILLLMRGSLPLSPRKPSPPRTSIRLYLRCIVFSWFLLSIVGIIVLHDGIPLSSIGLLLPTLWWPTLLALIGGGLLFAVVLVIHLHSIKHELFTAEEKGRLALPRTSSERLLWVGVSINAGMWEEIVFRGFLPWYLAHHVTFFGFSIPFIWAAIFSLILFSLGHLYQGWAGALRAGIAGIILALFYTLTGNLLASLLWHVLVDVRFSFWVATSESLTQPAAEMKDRPKSLPQPPLALRETPQRTSRQKQQCQHKGDQRGQPMEHIPYYARRLPPYPNLRAGRHQQPGPMWKK
jgi:uncharacterized protein